MQPTGITVFYALLSGIALMAIPLITCILTLLVLRRVDVIAATITEVAKAVDGKLELLIAAKEAIARAKGKADEREPADHTKSRLKQ